jgi:hypothetical protein
MTQTDQMNEMSFRSDEQAQSQDRERLQSEIQEAWDKVMIDIRWSPGLFTSESDLKLLRWALGLGS